MVEREQGAIVRRLVELTTLRHAKYGDTLFHLEPNIKEYPGGLRDAHVCGWLARLAEARLGPGGAAEAGEFEEAVVFLERVRCFLHYRHERDDNVLDWRAQDAAAAAGIGLAGGRGEGPGGGAVDAAYWMRNYFRMRGWWIGGRGNIWRSWKRQEETAAAALSRLARLAEGAATNEAPNGAGYRMEQGVVTLDAVEWVRDSVRDWGTGSGA